MSLIERRTNPQGCMIIPQPSRAFFDVGFHEVDSVGEAGVPLPVLSNLLSDKSESPLQGKAAMADFFMKPLKKRLITINKAYFEHSGLRREIGVRHLHDITPGPHAVAEGVTNIPEEVKRLAYDLVWRGLLAQKH